MNVKSELHEVEVEQGTDEWLAVRRMCVTATDGAALMGANPFRDAANTMNQLYWKKVLPDNYTPTAPMEYGTRHEPDAREQCNMDFHRDYQPKVYRRVIDGVPFMASLDGYCDTDGDVNILEIKCPYKGKQSYLYKGMPHIPENYAIQLEIQCRVMLEERALFMVWTPQGYEWTTYRRDDDLWERILENAKIFYGYLADGKEPPLTDGDIVRRNDAEWYEVTDALKTVNAKIAKLDEQRRVLRQQLIELSGGTNSEGNGVRLAKVYRRGGYDIKAISKHFNVEAYRKEPSASYVVRELVTADNQLN